MDARTLARIAALLVVTATTVVGCRGSSAHGAVVHEVIDGDTLVITIDGHREHVRLLGIDTPETKHPTKPVECFGPEAASRLASLLPKGTPLRVVRDVEARDHFGRLLLHVFIDSPSGNSTHINVDLVRGGFARLLSIPPNSAFEEVLGRALVEARRVRRGMWGACTQ